MDKIEDDLTIIVDRGDKHHEIIFPHDIDTPRFVQNFKTPDLNYSRLFRFLDDIPLFQKTISEHDLKDLAQYRAIYRDFKRGGKLYQLRIKCPQVKISNPKIFLGLKLSDEQGIAVPSHFDKNVFRDLVYMMCLKGVSINHSSPGVLFNIGDFNLINRNKSPKKKGGTVRSPDVKNSIRILSGSEFVFLWENEQNEESFELVERYGFRNKMSTGQPSTSHVRFSNFVAQQMIDLKYNMYNRRILNEMRYSVSKAIFEHLMFYFKQAEFNSKDAWYHTRLVPVLQKYGYWNQNKDFKHYMYELKKYALPELKRFGIIDEGCHIDNFKKDLGLEEIKKIKEDPNSKRKVTDAVLTVWAGRRLHDEVIKSKVDHNRIKTRERLLGN